MNRAALALKLIIVLVLSVLTEIWFVSLACADPLPAPPVTMIYIKADGSIEPSDAPIMKVGYVYTLTENLLSDSRYYFLIIQHDNIVVDGAGYIIQSHIRYPAAIYIKNMNNVTVKNFSIITTGYGISAFNSLHITCIANNITSASEGLLLDNCSESTISLNSLNDNYGSAIWLRFSTEINITKNSITWSRGNSYSPAGIHLSNSSGCIISGNNVTKSTFGIYLSLSSINFIYANNFISNEQPAFDEAQLAASYPEDLSLFPFSENIWDNNALGNYWSNYNGTDSDGDGIGDVPYIIDATNADHFPLMSPFTNPIIPPTPTSTPNEEPQITEQDLTTGAIFAVTSIFIFIALLFYFIKRK